MSDLDTRILAYMRGLPPLTVSEIGAMEMDDAMRDTLICWACDGARADKLFGGYDAWCLECSARMLAHSPAFFQSSRLGKMTPTYKATLKRILKPSESLEGGHERVKAWAARIRA